MNIMTNSQKKLTKDMAIDNQERILFDGHFN